MSYPEVSMRSYSTIALHFGQDNTKREQQLRIVCPYPSHISQVMRAYTSLGWNIVTDIRLSL